MKIEEIVMKLTGPVEPVGESNRDTLRLSNLGTLADVVDALIEEIARVAKYHDRHEASMSHAGKQATKWLAMTSRELGDYCEE